jgi:hypothetical protein
MSKARYQLPNKSRHSRFAKSEDEVSFQRDVREMRQYQGRAICRRSQSGGDTHDPLGR